LRTIPFVFFFPLTVPALLPEVREDTARRCTARGIPEFEGMILFKYFTPKLSFSKEWNEY
jgi:hypothetical protein